MKVIEVRPCEKFKGAWVSFEAPGIEPAFPDPNGKQDAIDYARARFGGSRGEIHVYCDDAVASSAGSSSTVAANIRKAAVIKKLPTPRRFSPLINPARRSSGRRRSQEMHSKSQFLKSAPRMSS